MAALTAEEAEVAADTKGLGAEAEPEAAADGGGGGGGGGKKGMATLI